MCVYAGIFSSILTTSAVRNDDSELCQSNTARLLLVFHDNMTLCELLIHSVRDVCGHNHVHTTFTPTTHAARHTTLMSKKMSPYELYGVAYFQT